MAIQAINLGTAPSGTGGDTNRSAFSKINNNFADNSNAASRIVGKNVGNLVEVNGAYGITLENNADNDFVGLSINNKKSGTTPATFLEFQLHNVVKSGVSTTENSDGSSNLIFTATPAGDGTKRREVVSLTVQSTGIVTPKATVNTASIGISAPNIATKKMTGTFTNGYTRVDHGLTASKILSCAVRVIASDGAIPFGNVGDINYGFKWWVDNFAVVIDKIDANTGTKLTKDSQFQIFIIYEV